MLEEMSKDAVSIYLLGDMFDFWMEYYRRDRSKRRFEPFLHELKSLVQAYCQEDQAIYVPSQHFPIPVSASLFPQSASIVGQPVRLRMGQEEPPERACQPLSLQGRRQRGTGVVCQRAGTTGKPPRLLYLRSQAYRVGSADQRFQPCRHIGRLLPAVYVRTARPQRTTDITQL